MSTITEQDIKALTPEHRIVWHEPPGQPVEMGLYVDGYEALRADTGRLVRYNDGSVQTLARSRIVRIIPPAFAPRVGMVIGKPGDPAHVLVCVEKGDWLGYAPELSSVGHWFSDDGARGLIEHYGWEVMGDLSAPGEVTDAEVRAAARSLDARHSRTGWLPWAQIARTALEAAREVRND